VGNKLLPAKKLCNKKPIEVARKHEIIIGKSWTKKYRKVSLSKFNYKEHICVEERIILFIPRFLKNLLIIIILAGPVIWP
jgi:hypothetical protein